MRSTGEVMGHAARLAMPTPKRRWARASPARPASKGEGVSAVLITVHDLDKAAVTKIARDLHQMGFEIIATRGTVDWLKRIMFRPGSSTKSAKARRMWST